jgi:hypothetical protein
MDGIGAAGSRGLGTAVFPLLAAVIALAFALRLGQRLVRRWRWHEGAWAVALLMFGAASGAMCAGVWRGWTPTEFRIYWALGAILNVPFLFLGEVYLLAPRAAGHAAAVVMAVLSGWTGAVVARARIHPSAFAAGVPLGKDVFGDGTLPYRLAQYVAIPAYVLLLLALVWAALTMRGQPHLRDRTAGTLGIAVGASIVAVGSGIGAARDIVPLFSVSLAAGVAVMFWGFHLATRPPRPASVPA